MKSKNPFGEDDDFPVLGVPVLMPIPSAKPPMAAAPRGLLKEDDFPSLSAATPRGTLKEDDFPSLSATASVVTTPMTPAYTAPPRNSSSFQEEDFPALVSKLWPKKPSGGSATAWSSHAKPTSASRGNHGPPPPSAFHVPVPPVPLTGPQPLSSSSSVAKSSRRKMRGGENAQPAAAPLRSSSDEEDGGLTQREFRAVPTMLDISSLLTVKSGNGVGGGGVSTGISGSVGGRTQAPPGSSDMTPVPTASKPSKKKKTQQQQQQPQQKKTLLPTTSSKLAASAKTKATTVAQKENVPEQSKNKPSPAPVATVTTVRAGTPSEMTNGYLEMALPPVTKKVSAAPAATSHTFPEPPPRDEEDFPALVTKKPPPGFKSSFPLKATAPPPAAPSSAVPPPPPGLASAPSKPPPPGFTGIPLNSNVVEPAPPPLNRPAQLPDSYMVPENFQQRNLELIQSIRNYLRNDESHFNQFKNYSGQFRQGVMSAAQYYRSCKELLGDNFQCIFNELLVLLPDTSRQQELLAAHGDSRALEKQSGGGSKKNKSKRNVWQTTPATNSNAAALAELDCQVCPTCRQVLAPKDFNSHKTLHLGENEDFPSLQSISRIIS